MKKQKRERTPWTKKRKIKLAAWLIIILAVAAGFLHQYIIHTEGHIKSHLEKNKTAYSQAAQMLLERPTSSEEFASSVKDELERVGAVSPDRKFSIGLLEDNPYYKDSLDLLEAVEDAGIQDVKSTAETVRFYHKSRFVLIYSPEKENITGAEKIGDGWFYIRSF